VAYRGKVLLESARAAKKQDGEYWLLAQLLCDHWQITAFKVVFAKGEMLIRSRVVAKSAGTGEPVLYRWMCYFLWTVALRWAIFKWIKRDSAT
jgi:hypothetical protein